MRKVSKNAPTPVAITVRVQKPLERSVLKHPQTVQGIRSKHLKGNSWERVLKVREACGYQNLKIILPIFGDTSISANVDTISL